jgi:hypothetical protein
MAQGGKREGAGRKRLPYEAKRVSIAMRVSPACADWLKDKALYYGCSLGQMVEHMMTLWREQERNYCGVKDNDEPYIKAFVSEFDKTMTQVMADMQPLTIEEAEALYQKAMSIRKDGK